MAFDPEVFVNQYLAVESFVQYLAYYRGVSLPDTFSTLRHMINSLNQMAFIFFPAEHDVQVGSLYTPP